MPSASNALRHGSHSFTCKLHHACLYSPAAEHHRPLAGTHFTVPPRVEGWVNLGGWLHTKMKCHLWESNPDTITHPSTNRAQRRLTSLTMLPLRHAATKSLLLLQNQLSSVVEQMMLTQFVLRLTTPAAINSTCNSCLRTMSASETDYHAGHKPTASKHRRNSCTQK